MKTIKLSILSFLVLSSISTFAQDIIITSNGDTIRAKIKEITEIEIKYVKFDNQDGPTYTKSISNITQVKYKNGEVETFKNNLQKNAAPIETSNTITSKEKTGNVLQKGNKVFIQVLGEQAHKGEAVFLEELKNWGYWNITTNKTEANFTIVLNMNSNAMPGATGWVALVSNDGKEIAISEKYRRGHGFPNGFNGYKDVAEVIVKKYFKKEFKN